MIKYLLLTLILITGCYPSKREMIRRLQSSEGARIIIEKDTVITKEVEADTIFCIDSLFIERPFIIEKEKLRVHIERVSGDSILINAECNPETLFVEKKRIILPECKEDAYEWWEYTIFVFSIIGAGLLITMLIKIIV